MTRLIVEAQGQLQSEVVPLTETEGVLIGRTPNPSTLHEGGSGDGRTDEEKARVAGTVRETNVTDAHLPSPQLTIRAQAIPSPSVSGNHALVWLTEESLHIRDLGSRNGTWVRLPRGASVRVPLLASPANVSTPPDTLDVHLRLASSMQTGGSVAQPEPPRYLDQTDFGSSIALAIRAWLQHHEVPARVWSVPRDRAGEAPTGATPIPLENGDVLFIQVEHTADVMFHERITQISRYVRAQNALYAAEENTRSDGMILASPAIRQVHRRVVEVAMQSLPSLILLGPSGTGKERLAQAYHRHLGRTGPLVAINCATLSRDRIVADLFGAEAGAYTDAKRAMMGAVERADGGTLLLDELGELPLDVQPMLLRFLETGEYQRLGATGRPRFADVCVVGATNRDLRQMVRNGGFREDLFFRLALEIVDVPSLRERFADVEAYLRSRMLGETSAYDALQDGALELFRSYSWPGNFREVMNLVRRLPSPAQKRSLDIDVARRALEAGSLAPIATPSNLPPPLAPTDSSQEHWLEWLRSSALAFSASSGQEAPRTWSDMSTYIEHFLKPRALAHLAGVSSARSMEDVAIHQVAERVKADRGTVIKQLRRFFESKKD